MEYPILLNTSSNWLGVAAHQNDHALGGNCSCMGHQLVCTMFCACGSGSTFANPFSTKTSVTDVTDNSDTESDDDNHDHDID